MSSRTVVSLLMDLCGSTAAGLAMSGPRFQRFNKAHAEQIKPYLQEYDVEDSEVKFVGDGWLIVNSDLEKAAALVCMAKNLAAKFQEDVANLAQVDPATVPPLRIAVCAGEDQLIKMPDNTLEWVGDSARRATRASECCLPNQVIVNGTVRDKVFRCFGVTRLDVPSLPPQRQPKRWEEEFDIYGVDDIIEDFIDDFDLAQADDPSLVAPYATYLGRIGRREAERRTLDAAEEAIAERTLAEMPRQITDQAILGPAELVRLSVVRSQMFRLLMAATETPMREQILKRMTGMGVSPDVRIYTTLISRAPDYPTAVEWFEKMRAAGVPPNDVTFSTLINVAPDYPTAVEWFEKMRAAGVPPDVFTFSTLINVAPDYPTAVEWFEKMRAAGVAPDEVTAATLAKHVTKRAEVDALTKRLIEDECFIGEAYFSRIYGVLATQLSAEELLGWYASQKYRRSRALGAAIARYAGRDRIDDALRVALAFPYLDAARKVFREHNPEALEYYTELLERDFESYNAVYALAYCHLESGDDRAAADLFEAALADAGVEQRRQDIEARLAEVRARLAS